MIIGPLAFLRVSYMKKTGRFTTADEIERTD